MEKCTRPIFSDLSPAQILGQISTLRRIISALALEALERRRLKSKKITRILIFNPRRDVFYIAAHFFEQEHGFFFPFFTVRHSILRRYLSNFTKLSSVCLKENYFFYTVSNTSRLHQETPGHYLQCMRSNQRRW